MRKLRSEIRGCEVSKEHLPLGLGPIVACHSEAKISIIGQAPETKAHETGVLWNDLSGRQLRKWLRVEYEVFYDETKIALMPMGFCYPGKGKGGNLPARKECSPPYGMSNFGALCPR